MLEFSKQNICRIVVVLIMFRKIVALTSFIILVPVTLIYRVGSIK